MASSEQFEDTIQWQGPGYYRQRLNGNTWEWVKVNDNQVQRYAPDDIEYFQTHPLRQTKGDEYIENITLSRSSP